MNIFLDLISCSNKYTWANRHNHGDMAYLDRHKPDCGTGKVMSYYRLERSGKNMRYRYKCCQFKGNVYTMQQKYTSFNNDGNGKMYYLDRHTADCGPYGFISSIRIERNSGHDKVMNIHGTTVSSLQLCVRMIRYTLHLFPNPKMSEIPFTYYEKRSNFYSSSIKRATRSELGNWLLALQHILNGSKLIT